MPVIRVGFIWSRYEAGYSFEDVEDWMFQRRLNYGKLDIVVESDWNFYDKLPFKFIWIIIEDLS